MKEQFIALDTKWVSLEKETKQHFLGVGLFVLFCLMDGVITQINLQMGAHEINPLLNFSIHNLGILGIYLAKLPMLLLIFLLLEMLRKRGQFHHTRRILLFANILYFFVCVTTLLQTYIVSFVI